MIVEYEEDQKVSDDFTEHFWRLSELHLYPYDEAGPLVSTITKEEIGIFVLYVVPEESSFHFLCTEWACDDGDEWVQIIAYGTAFFDGIRHIHFGCDKDPEMKGYINYPDMKSLELLIKRLQELEKQYCKGCEANEHL